MKREFLCQLRKDTDIVWKGGMGITLILLLLCMGILGSTGENIGFPDRANLCLKLMTVYGITALAVLTGVYFTVVRCVNQTLYQFGDMIEHLTNGQPEITFPAGEDTILSRLQEQLMRFYDIMHSYEERERLARRQLDENIGDLVHQLNTPITNIRIYTEFLERDDLTAEENRRFIKCLKEQAQKLSWLGESFSKISRLEMGIIRLKPENQKLEPVILHAVSQIMEKARQKGIHIVLKGDVHQSVTVDGKWTAEAVFNVLDNAVKYGDADSEIEIEAVTMTNYVSVAVRNCGIGIDAAEYHHLFKRFYRGKGSGVTEGSGLGLYIVRKILEDEKGYVTVGSTRDGRTEFVLYLYQT
ncbi:MAG: HAMP domain-containing histidine kinase [Lachnospiraceae bacterium]|nr:HAMP domain-containing sensor histidine kinase [Parablautia intestinalis]MCI8615041.1 HAMP domain-containing histidine kinase [Lachnospiraceae bacterium]